MLFRISGVALITLPKTALFGESRREERLARWARSGWRTEVRIQKSEAKVFEPLRGPAHPHRSSFARDLWDLLCNLRPSDNGEIRTEAHSAAKPQPQGTRYWCISARRPYRHAVGE